MLLNGSEPGFWKGVVTDLVLHPHRSFSWVDGLLIAGALLAFVMLEYLLGAAVGWVARRAGRIGVEYRRANGPPPRSGDQVLPPD
jgi:hypothetical protein